MKKMRKNSHANKLHRRNNWQS